MQKFKALTITLCLSSLIACQTKTKSSDNVPVQPNLQTPSNNTSPANTPVLPTVTEEPAPKMEVGSVENTAKIGVILGPGALRSYAHVGVLTEFAKAKLPIHAIAGIEMGALVAAIYANKGQPYDAEWQMMKLKESDVMQKSLLSSAKTGDVRSLNEFMNIALSSAKAENSKVNFACPAFHIEKRQTYVMNRGVFSQMLPYCLAFPPLFGAYQKNISGISDLKPLLDYMKSKSVNYIVYVDLLAGNNKMDSADFEIESLWALAAANLTKQEKSMNEIIRVPLQEYTLTDFSKRREIMQKGQQIGQRAAQTIKRNLGL